MNWWQQHLGRPVERSPRPLDPALRPPNYVKPPEIPIPQPIAQRPGPPSSRNPSYCPECGGSNYMAAPGSNYHRCYDCGFPVQQSGSRVGGLYRQSEGPTPTRKATQVESGGFNPGVIVGKVE